MCVSTPAGVPRAYLKAVAMTRRYSGGLAERGFSGEWYKGRRRKTSVKAEGPTNTDSSLLSHR